MIKRTVFFILLICSLSHVAAAHVEIDLNPVSAKLVSEYNEVQKGEKFTLAVVLDPKPGWHLYWKYAGDYGSAPKFYWDVHQRAVEPTILWPTPEVIKTKNYINYGYERKVFYLADFSKDDSSVNETHIHIALSVEWLACKVECIPGFAELSIRLPLIHNEKNLTSGPYAKEIRETRANVPLPDNKNVTIDTSETGLLTFRFKDLSPETIAMRFIPETRGLIANNAQQIFDLTKKTHTVETLESFNPTKGIEGILVKEPPWTKQKSALRVSNRKTSSVAKPLPSHNTIFMILAAFLGGLILNLMPCIFPVIALKILHFSKKAGKESRIIKLQGLCFSAGILCCFWALATAIHIVRGFGENIGWGFQLQEPNFVLFLIFLLFLVTLNLFGLFEIHFLTPQRENNESSSELGSAFLSGILTTVLATPCTAPFMATALGYALSASAGETFLIFTALGLGLATPYIILCFSPALLRYLPKPGTWMIRFKQLLAFPLLATVLWLIWVYEQQTSPYSAFIILAAFIFLALAAWLYGKYSAPAYQTKTRRLSLLLFLMFNLTLGLIISQSTPQTPEAPMHIDSIGRYTTDRYGLRWHSYSDDLLNKLLIDGGPVYLDATAAWCLTCHVNKANVFSSKEVQHAIKEKNVTLLRADWTNRDSHITKLLKRFKRAGVPLNVYFKSGKEVILPTILTPGIVLSHIQGNDINKGESYEN